ncbi:MAG TPA: response regulator transcription factor [Candidatus Melainabacteria bacterium]|jgi:DNA-binding response OmpR family regulator|nr:response regulator transcription factor [Candidatus Melainabacteria bacterium]HIN64694.1 response regulator transcription factor [Candidatus Obscuribacterales bacterium]
MPKLLLVEDDTDLSTHLCDLLESHGWQVEKADNGADGLMLLRNFKYDFALLDWNLPELSGIEICRKFRADGGDTPVIFLTSKGEIEDKECGLDAGGDDYLTKPFDVRELLARMRSVERRRKQVVPGKLEIRGVTLDPKLRRVQFREQEAQLTLKECTILEHLIQHAGSYFTSPQLFEALWPSDVDSSEETVRVHMKMLRGKLEKIGCTDLIKTVRGAGYIIESGKSE